MPNTREKLIDLLKSGGVRNFPFNAALADRLIANGVTVQKWISVKERLPKAYEDVLAFRESGCEVEFCLDVKNSFWQNDPISEYLVTHWMPLPQPPKGE